MPALSLDIDLDLLASIVDESLPWFEAWAALVALALALVVLVAAHDFVRRRNAPVARLMRRRSP